RPERFRVGIIAIVVGLCWWLIPAYFIRIDNQRLEMPLLLLALFITVCVLSGGVKAISMADNKPGDDFWDNLSLTSLNKAATFIVESALH
ncbi:MAG TPA: hypothetical protein VE616_05730, partial [Candidatus Udaeobacter sp.]|nr:hypothetical protein [Candidatus Udaeobacter sp.]